MRRPLPEEVPDAHRDSCVLPLRKQTSRSLKNRHDERLAEVHIDVGEVLNKEKVESLIAPGEVEAPIGQHAARLAVGIDQSCFFKKRQIALEIVATIDPL
jgi:hypothetical protein